MHFQLLPIRWGLLTHRNQRHLSFTEPAHTEHPLRTSLPTRNSDPGKTDRTGSPRDVHTLFSMSASYAMIRKGKMPGQLESAVVHGDYTGNSGFA